VSRLRLAFLLAGVFALGCNVGTFPKDPTTPNPDWPDVPPDDPVFAAAGGSSCANAIENTKRLGCGFEAADPAAWCKTLTAEQVKCLAGSKNCRVNSLCTEASK